MNALVTGGTHGIGAAIAYHMLQQTVHVAVVGRKVETFNAFVKDFGITQPQLARLVYIPGDITSKETVEAINHLLVHWSGVDVLVNNVGGGGRWGPENAGEATVSLWEEVLNKNLLTAVRMTNMCLPYMLENMYGRVISIASNYGKEMLPGGRPWFVSSKAALIAYMKAMSKQPKYASNGITFNSISPGPIMLEGTGWAEAKKDDPLLYTKFVEDNIPTGVMEGPEDVVSAFDFLWKSSYVNGSNIVVDGGMSNSY